MSTDSESRQDSGDEDIDISAYQANCFVSLTRLTDEEIERLTNPSLMCLKNDNSLLSSDHGCSMSNVTYESDATTIEDMEMSISGGLPKKVDPDGPTSLYDDDEIISIELNRTTRKKAHLLDKCVIPEKLVKLYNFARKRSSTTLPMFCLFCLKEYNQVSQVLSCHYQQAKHFPFRCVECEEVTLDTKDMMQHYAKTHPSSACVQYRRSFAPAKERWVRKFVVYQLKCITNQATMVPNGILHKYCPVCNQWDYKLGEKFPKNKPQHKFFEVLDKNHIHKHLKYHPFQCLLCLKQNIRCDFTIINKKAKLHLINRHGFSAPTEEDLKNNFDLLGMIPELERYINSYVKFVQDSFDRRPFIKSPIASSQNSVAKKMLSTPSPSVATKQSTPISILSSVKKSCSKAITKLSTDKKRRKIDDYSIDDMYYPYPKYARKEYNKRKYERKLSFNSLNADSCVIDLDSFYEDSGNPFTKPDETPKIICFFCDDQMSDILAAWDHYAIHLEYRPINCQLCHKSFPGPKAFQLHGSDHVDHDNLPYTWNHDEIIEGWSRDFLNSIYDDTIANPEFSCFCPICCKKFTVQNIGSQNLSYEDVRKHIFTHLRYKPYSCNLCPDDKVFIADLENEGTRHLSFHGIICSKEELSAHFKRSRGIEIVDSFLENHFNKIQKLFNSPHNCINEDVNVSDDPLVDVESLYNSLSETLGYNTLNNILEKVSNNEEQPSTNQNVNEIDYPCTPSSTTSDPVTTCSPHETSENSSPPSIECDQHAVTPPHELTESSQSRPVEFDLVKTCSPHETSENSSSPSIKCAVKPSNDSLTESSQPQPVNCEEAKTCVPLETSDNSLSKCTESGQRSVTPPNEPIEPSQPQIVKCDQPKTCSSLEISENSSSPSTESSQKLVTPPNECIESSQSQPMECDPAPPCSTHETLENSLSKPTESEQTASPRELTEPYQLQPVECGPASCLSQETPENSSPPSKESDERAVTPTHELTESSEPQAVECDPTTTCSPNETFEDSSTLSKESDQPSITTPGELNESAQSQSVECSQPTICSPHESSEKSSPPSKENDQLSVTPPSELAESSQSRTVECDPVTACSPLENSEDFLSQSKESNQLAVVPKHVLTESSQPQPVNCDTSKTCPLPKTSENSSPPSTESGKPSVTPPHELNKSSQTQPVECDSPFSSKPSSPNHSISSNKSITPKPKTRKNKKVDYKSQHLVDTPSSRTRSKTNVPMTLRNASNKRPC